ncbi:MAG: cupredoxin domain-containing protein [bacterium]
MKRNIVMLVGTMISFAILGVPGCKSDSPNSSPAPSNIPPNTVVMGARSFNPATLTVASGTTVTWRNGDSDIHTSTSDDRVWDTGDMRPGVSSTTVFNTPGTFRFHCIYHGTMGMVGTITVQ